MRINAYGPFLSHNYFYRRRALKCKSPFVACFYCSVAYGNMKLTLRDLTKHYLFVVFLPLHWVVPTYLPSVVFR